MAYDEDLAARLRDLLRDEPGVSEKTMFGGVAFLVDGALAIAASSQGGVLVRVDPAASDHLLATTHAQVAVMRGRPLTGWLRVPAEDLRTRRQLETWARRGVDHARSLTPRTAGRQG